MFTFGMIIGGLIFLGGVTVGAYGKPAIDAVVNWIRSLFAKK
jgi:hypothetical protein